MYSEGWVREKQSDRWIATNYSRAISRQLFLKMLHISILCNLHVPVF